jgi:toxin YhaV
MVVNGRTLLFHEAIDSQLKNLASAFERARKADPKNYRSNANVKLFAALAKLMLEVIPADPGGPEYRQGNTLGAEYRHWFRAKFLGRFRLFFRYDSRARIIVYACAVCEGRAGARGQATNETVLTRAPGTVSGAQQGGVAKSCSSPAAAGETSRRAPAPRCRRQRGDAAIGHRRSRPGREGPGSQI